jgi:pimeloyl-ACP methyl ester carboxylesterase
MPTEILEHLLNTDAVTINYAEGPPSGPPLVLLHGGSGRWQNYEGIIPDLAPRFHLYAPDFRGHGKSGRVPGRYQLQDYANDTITFLRQCVADPIFLFGSSLGGMVALMVAAQAPGDVRAVVVGDAPLTRRIDSSAHRDRTRARGAAWRDLAGGRLSIDEIVEALKDSPTEIPGQDEPVTMREKHGEDAGVFAFVATNLFYTDPDMLTAVLDGTATVGYEMEKVLPAIRCPVLLLQADPDAGGMMTDAEVERALPLLAHPRHVRFEQRSHALFLPDKEPVLRAIVEFFNSLS